MPVPMPRRISLVEQCADALRANIQSSRWGTSLPAERRLCETLQVSRNTLRRALDILTKTGWIAPGRPGARRIIRPRAGITGRSGVAPIARAVLLTPYSPDHLPPFLLSYTDILRTLLAPHGFQFVVRGSTAFHQDQPDRGLYHLTQELPSSVWILQRPPRPVQEWFSNSRLPTLIMGMPYPGISLPHVSEDFEAAAASAVTKLLALGHRRIALLRHSRRPAGHDVVERTMKEILDKATPAGELIVLVSDETTEATFAAVRQQFAETTPPTALITILVKDTLTTLTGLALLGKHPPSDYSLISLFTDTSLEAVVPAVTHYQIDRPRFLRQLVTGVLDMAHQQHPVASRTRLIPKFIPGETLGAAPPR